MEMENINENTIRVLIENADLEERGITFLDLLGNQKQIESFFYSILEEVDVDNQFQETDAITFQVLPNGNGLELFISKGDIDDFDSFDEADNPTEHIIDYIKKQAEHKKGTKSAPVKEDDTGMLEVMIKFTDFEHFIDAAQRFHLEAGLSTLYHFKSDYYLSLVFFLEEMIETNLDVDISIALEFGEEAEVSIEVLSEYGQIVMKNDALETARHYFK